MRKGSRMNLNFQLGEALNFYMWKFASPSIYTHDQVTPFHKDHTQLCYHKLACSYFKFFTIFNTFKKADSYSLQ